MSAGQTSEEKEAETARNNANNTNALNNAADVAIASKNPYAMAAGAAYKGLNKVTGGKFGEAAGKGLTKANKLAGPAGKGVQNATNKLSESGMADKAGQAARMYNGAKGGGAGAASSAGGKAAAGAELAKKPSGSNMDGLGRGQSMPSSNANGAAGSSAGGNSSPKIAGVGPFGKQPGDNNDDSSSGSDDSQSSSSTNVLGKMTLTQKAILMLALPAATGVLGILLMFVVIENAVLGGSFDDALGSASASGEDMGIADSYTGADKDAQDYYERINNVKLEFQAQGKSFESTNIAAVFHVLMENGANLDYKDITEDKIREVANYMFDGNTYSEDYFKEKLSIYIIPKYLPLKTDDEIEDLVDEIMSYVTDYYEYIEKSASSSLSTTCGTLGSCAYEIKGFYVNNQNVTKKMSITNLKVRLMQCGSPYGNGSYTTPIDQDLVDFEDYAAGVAYAEIGDSYPIEAIKAQLVMARSFALSRPTGMGNSLGKKLEEENGQWILQISSCVADQVFCNIDQGCSYMGGGDGQGGYVVSGTSASGAERTRAPLSATSNIRTAAAATEGEVLVNSQGYIIETGYKAGDQNNIKDLAESGLDYKQILMKKYASSGASDIDKMSCSSSSNCTPSTGEYANWKQCGATWSSTAMGSSGSTICQIGCLATSVSILIAKSGVQTNITNFNPGTFVEFMSNHGGFDSGGNFVWNVATQAAPTFKYQGQISVSGWSKEQKLAKIKELLADGAYITCEVKGNTGQHWVAVDNVNGDTINMMDPGSSATNMWEQYSWSNTSTIAYYKVG